MASVNDYKPGDVVCYRHEASSHDRDGVWMILGHEKGRRYLMGMRVNEYSMVGKPIWSGGPPTLPRLGSVSSYIQPGRIARCDGDRI